MHPTLIPLGLSLLLSLSGCTGKYESDDTGGSSDGGDGSDGTGGDISPALGHWTSIDEEITNDTCGFTMDSGSPVGGYTLADAGGGAYAVTLDADDPSAEVETTCTLSGAAISCEPGELVQDGTSDGVDLIATLSIELSGAFQDNRSMDGAAHFSAECEGADCDLLISSDGFATLPCGMDLSFSSTAD
jgi:hypothetical protein